MRNPNGFGSVVKLSGNRRKPYMARLTVGYNDNGTPIYKAIDYFTNRTDALICLAQFNQKPCDVNYRNITLAELYKKLQEIKFPKMGKSLQTTLKAAYKHCGALHDMRYRQIKAYQMQRCIDGCGLSYATQTNIKNLFYHLDNLAFELDIIEKKYSDVLTVATASAKEKTIFSDQEVQTLWKHQGEDGIDQVLFMLYTGFRISEMLMVKTDDIDLSDKTITGGVKTKAGKNRIVPIHDDIFPVIQRHLSDGYLFPESSVGKSDYVSNAKKSYGAKFKKIMQSLGMNHTTHECRHTFRSKLDSAQVNKVCIDLIMGHKSSDVGERVYTHKTKKELQEAISKLSYNV